VRCCPLQGSLRVQQLGRPAVARKEATLIYDLKGAHVVQRPVDWSIPATFVTESVASCDILLGLIVVRVALNIGEPGFLPRNIALCRALDQCDRRSK
jgi:hypothetical protein